MPSEIILPEPPDPAELDPLITRWPADELLIRVHSREFTATAFNPGHGRGRFHPFSDTAGHIVPVLYAANSIDGALAETVFRAVPLTGSLRAILRRNLSRLVFSRLMPRSALTLIDLRGHGLRRIGLKRSQLLETEADDYARTGRWAKALHAVRPEAQGLIWISRQFDTSAVMVLFGDRVADGALEAREAPTPLDRGTGLTRVRTSAEQAGIVVLE